MVTADVKPGGDIRAAEAFNLGLDLDSQGSSITSSYSTVIPRNEHKFEFGCFRGFEAYVCILKPRTAATETYLTNIPTDITDGGKIRRTSMVNRTADNPSMYTGE